MTQTRKLTRGALFALMLTLMLACFALHSASAFADYTRGATLKDGSNYPGVYYVKAEPGDCNATIGIPSIDKNTLNTPTTESPAIIMGAAVPYETKTGPTSFTPKPGGALYPPYSYFRYRVINEQGADGTWHEKMSGFDGSYYIIRVDVTDLIKDAPAGSFLHVKQEGNKALMVMAPATKDANGQYVYYTKYTEEGGMGRFPDALGNMAAVYAIDNGAIALKDKSGNDSSTPYVDVIVFSSGTLVAGADTGSADPNTPNADYKLKFYIDQTADYNPGLDYDPNNQSTGTPTHAEQVMAKFYDESKASGATVTSYTIKGSDLEIEIIHPGPEGSAAEFWSLRKAMEYYNGTPIKMICEVPVLEGLRIDGGRNVIFDVNSFDIQLANHQTTGAAALTIENGTLKIMDGFNTTGAELAVGNNAKMYIGAGGKLIIDETCQVEVEYDAASVAPTEGATPVTYDVGLITIASGGEIDNNGIISIEGTEGKPIDPANPAMRDMKAAELHIEAGGKLTNNGSLVVYGGLYNKGTLVNNGLYKDVLTSKDPDKGQFTYHKGIQIAWKDDVTQSGVRMGYFSNGAADNQTASFTNNGDLVLVPGFLENYGTLENTANGSMYLCEVDQAVIPMQVSWSVLIQEQRIGFERPMAVYFTSYPGATLQNAGKIAGAKVDVVGNGNLGTLTQAVPTSLDCDICVDNFGQFTNSGTIDLNAIYNFGQMNNSGSVSETNKIILEANTTTEGRLTDTAGLTNIYNAARTTEGNTNTWTRVGCEKITVTPASQPGIGGERVSWGVKALTKQPDAQGVQYYVLVYQGNGTTPQQAYTITANEDNVINSPALPQLKGNAVYRFHLLDGLESVYTEAAVNITPATVTPPAAIQNLVYNGKDQNLVTTGSTNSGSLLYRLGTDGEWTNTVPTAKNAGSYTVYYKLSGDSETATPASVEASIAKKPVTVSADDAATQVGTALATPGYTVSGLVTGETLNGVSATTNANKDAVGTYTVTATISGENPNYEITVREGKYTVTTTAFAVTAKDKYGVFSDETTYKGFNIDLTVPQGATAYYHPTKELTAENYQTDGMTALTNLPAKAGTHTIYYYVTNGTDAVSGSKQVIIDKAAQNTPDVSKLFTRSETWRNSLDGYITGLTARKMEYRNKANDGTYTLAYIEKVYVEPGTYLVRMAADENHYASPDVEVTVAQGPYITISFDLNGSKSEFQDVTGLSYGDQLPRPTSDPSMPDASFLGWFYWSGTFKPFDFNAPLNTGMTLIAGWAPKTVDFKLPGGTKQVGESAFEGVPVKCVEIPASCEWIYPNAFKGCTTLKQVHLLSADTKIVSTAFDGCKDVYIFAPEGSLAQSLCTEANGFIFVKDLK